MFRQRGSQTTLRERVRVTGVGVHSGRAATVTLNPAEPDSGICFLRTDLDGEAANAIPAERGFVVGTDHSTRLARNGASVATVEHLMAALCAVGVDNALIEIDGPEVPIMDGSAAAFIEAIDQAGIALLGEPRRFIRILKPIRVEAGAAWGELRPHEGSSVEVEIDFDHALVGRQRLRSEVTPSTFRRDIAKARTFGFLADVEKLWAAGLARGATLENCVVVGEDRIVNPEGLRFADEFVRHKALDAIGDLSLAGAPIIGAYRSYRGGHGLNLQILNALFADQSAFAVVEAPSRAIAGNAEVSGLAQSVAFSPDIS